MRGVEQRDAWVSYSGGPLLGINWDPFLWAPGGEIQIAPTQDGFELRFRLGIWRLLLVGAWAVVFSYWVTGEPLGHISVSLALLTGLGWGYVAWMDLVALPGKVRRLITPPSDEIPWSPFL